MSKQASYQSTGVILIRRQKHKVTFHVGMKAEELISVLQTHVPAFATIDEVISDNAEEWASIEFHEESQQKVSDEVISKAS